MKFQLSFRWFLVLLYLGTVVPLLAAVGLFIYQEHEELLITGASNRLRNMVNGEIESDELVSSSQVTDLPHIAARVVDGLRYRGIQAFILDEQGRLLAPQGTATPWLDPAVHDSARTSRTASIHRVPDPNNNRLVYLLPIQHPNGQIVGTIEANISLRPVEEDIAGLRTWLFLTIGPGSVLVLLSAFVISGAAMQPLRKLVDTARAVTQGDFDRRTDLPHIKELRTLAMAFNTMLEQIQSALTAQARSTAAVHRFVADASHELRSPLMVIKNSVDVLPRVLKHNHPKQIEQVLGLLRSEVESMSRLMDQLLLLARMEPFEESADKPLVIEMIEPLPLLEEIYERAKVMATGQLLTLEWPREPIPPIEADRELVRRALNNLVQNSLHHTPPGKRVTLAIERSPEGCRFMVSDEGSGISPDHLPNIFERFYRADSSRNSGQSGRGLGLTIVRAIVAAHHGQIEVASQLGAGTAITLTFPSKYQPVFSGASAPVHSGLVEIKLRGEVTSRERR